MPSNLFQSGLTTVQFERRPIREGNGYAPELLQVTGFDSNGAQFVYDKGWVCRQKHTLTFPHVSGSILASFRSFSSTTVRGNFKTFTWYDHDEASHTVRLSNGFTATPAGPDRYRVQLELEEDVAWGAPVLPGTYGDKVAAPLWILKLTINSVDYYLSDGTVTVTPWSVTTKPWIGAWGAIRTGISGSLSEFRVSDFSISLLSDPAVSPNMESLATTYPLEKSAAELYLWMVGTAEPPNLMFRGYVDDVDVPDETSVNLVIRDETSRLHAYIGTKLDVATYPNADPDDIGKVIPIVYGTVAKVPSLAVDAGHMTTLVSAIDGDDTSLVFSEITGFSVGTKFWIDQEKMTITGISDTTVTVTRAVDSTTAQNHGEAAIIWEDKSAFVYMVADHPVDAISKVFGKVGEGVLDITSVCTRYIGQAGNVLTGYTGKAMVTVPGRVTAAQAVALGFVDAGSVVGLISLQSLIALTDPGHTHTSAATMNQETTNNLPYNTWTWYDSGTYYQNGATGTGNRMTISFPTDVSGRTQIVYKLTFRANYSDPMEPVVVMNGSSIVWNQSGAFGTWDEDTERTLVFTITNATLCNLNTVVIHYGGSAGSPMTLVSAERYISTSGISSSSDTTGASIDADNLELSGNSVANTLVGDAVLATVTRAITPINVFTDLLTRAGSSAVAVLSGSLPSSYGVNGAITEYKQAKEWLNTIAFQLRSWFVMERGIASLIVRPSTLTSTRTISACRVTDDGVKVHRRRKADSADVLNMINLLYNRDWTQSSGDTAYQGSVSDSDATSITNYGEHEQPDLFQCDFITSDTMAADVRDYFLDNYSGRPWLHEFEAYLDYSDVRFGQVVTLGFAGSAVGIVIEAGPSPGSGNDIDTMKFTVMV